MSVEEVVANEVTLLSNPIGLIFDEGEPLRRRAATLRLVRKAFVYPKARCLLVSRYQTILIAALLTIGVVGGLVYNWPFSATENESTTSSAAASQEPDEGLPPDEEPRGLTLTEVSSQTPNAEEAANLNLDLDPIRQGDRLLLGGNAIGAYKQYQRIPTDLAKSMSASIKLRMALAAEDAGFLEQAERHFSDTIAAATRGTPEQIWALIGTGRIWDAQNRVTEATHLLSELYLMTSSESYPAQMRLAISKQLSDALQKRTLASVDLAESSSQTAASKQQQLTDVLQYHWCQTQLQPMLQESSWRRTQDDGQAKDILEVVQRPIDDVSLILANVKSWAYPISQLLNDLERAASIKIDLSATARSTIAGRSARVDAVAMPIALLLDQTLCTHSLVWDQRGGIVTISHADEWNADQNKRFALQRAQRLQRQLQIYFPDGIQRIAALMHDANNSFLLGEVGAAAEKYDAARGLEPVGELNAKILFNAATLALQQSDFDSAINDYYLALDQTLSPELQAMAYSWIGEIEIRLGRPQRAVAAASRGLRLATQAEEKNRALMALAKAYLLLSDAYSANQVLFNHASSLTDPSNRRLATVLSTHSRFQVVKPTNGLQNEGERLVLSLAALQAGDAKDFVEHLMVSRAFAAVGFRSKAIEHLTKAADEVPIGYWQSRIPIELAEILREAGKPQKALETLQSMEQVDDPSLRIRSLLMQNEIVARTGNPSSVIENCKALLQLSLDEADQKRVMKMLGNAYQNSGQHYSAALCFAGLLPEGDSNELRNSSTVTP